MSDPSTHLTRYVFINYSEVPVIYQFHVYGCFCIITVLQNSAGAYHSVLFKDDLLGSVLGNLIISSPSLYIFMQQSLSLSWIDSILRKKVIKFTVKKHYNTTDCNYFNCYHTQVSTVRKL